MGFTSKTEDITFINFKTNLQKEIRTIASDFGSVKKLELIMPGNSQKFCMIDIAKKDDASTYPICIDSDPEYNALICDAWENPSIQPDGSGSENAFLVPMQPIKVSNIEIQSEYFCVEPGAGGRIALKIEGRGDSTRISAW